MKKLIDKTLTQIENPDAVIGFEVADMGSIWQRYLTIDGKRAYSTGLYCETCSYFFERLSDANQSVSPAEVSEEFREGLTSLEKPLVDKVSKIIPTGDYLVTLLNFVPVMVKLGSKMDYFASEQLDLWGISGFWDIPHHPKIEYYRGASLSMGGGDHLFEFIVPMFPKSWLDQNQIKDYSEKIKAGIRPTALAISFLDVKQPANWRGNPEITRHYCLTHYVIDGHHKTFAASELGKPITLLSFIVKDKSLIAETDINRVMQLLESSNLKKYKPKAKLKFW